MLRHDVESSLIKSVAYDPASSILEVVLHNGAIYDYFDVPYSILADLLESESKGTFFNEEIRDNYEYEVVSPSTGRDATTT